MEKIRKIVREILKEAFEFRNDAKSFVPPISVKNIAQQAQQVSQQRKTPLTSIDGNVNEGSGENMVQNLINQEPLSHPQIKRYVAFFENNKIKADSEKSLGKNMSNSDILLVWNLHGGDECMNWSNKELDKTKDSNLRTKANMRFAGTGSKDGEGMGSFDIKNLMNPHNTRTHGQNLAKR